MRTQHIFDRRNRDKGRNAFYGPWNHESYKGDYLVEPASDLGVQMHRKVIGGCTVIHARSRARQSFRRSWTHIREDATDVVVLCFVKRGYLRLEHPCGEAVAQAGYLIAASSIAPFFMECDAGSEHEYEALHLIVPAHMLRQHLCRELPAGFCVHLTGRTFTIAERILAELVEDQGDIGEAAARLLVDAALASLSDSINGNEASISCRPEVADFRQRAITRYIDLHLCNPSLSVGLVAEGCGVSPRYIFSVFQRQGKTFSSELWTKRLNVAAHWLSTSKSGDTTIREIAYRAGFKSAAHFTRMFKREFKESPRTFRGTSSPPIESDLVALVSHGGSRH